MYINNQQNQNWNGLYAQKFYNSYNLKGAIFKNTGVLNS